MPAERGRPSEYTPERAEAICGLIETHAQGLRWLHRKYPDVVPDIHTVNKWLAEHADFLHRYARAREAQADLLVDQSLEILDGVDVEAFGKAGNAAVSLARERAVHRRWMAGRLSPRRWGDRQITELTGSEGKPIEVKSEQRTVRTDQLADIATGLEGVGAIANRNGSGGVGAADEPTKH